MKNFPNHVTFSIAGIDSPFREGKTEWAIEYCSGFCCPERSNPLSYLLSIVKKMPVNTSMIVIFNRGKENE